LKTNRLSSTSQSRLARCIDRVFPEVLERMKRGEFRSVRAAVLSCGIVRPTLTIPADPQRAGRALDRHFTDAGHGGGPSSSPGLGSGPAGEDPGSSVTPSSQGTTHR
jgi:hypothetical protein